MSEPSWRTIPPALENVAEIKNGFGDRKPVFFLDYDGTLTPIVERPELAVMSDDMRNVVHTLSRRFPVSIISGRGLDDVRQKVNLDDLVYAGSHGFEIAGPRDTHITHDIGKRFIPRIDDAEYKLRRSLDSIPGILIERKKASVAVHYRLVEEEYVPRVESAVDRVVMEIESIRKSGGKKVFELQPEIDWHKGKAVNWLIDRLWPESHTIFPLYIGDDVTDENAFRALHGIGLGIVVMESDRPSEAEYRLRNTGEVREFLSAMADLRKADER